MATKQWLNQFYRFAKELKQSIEELKQHNIHLITKGYAHSNGKRITCACALTSFLVHKHGPRWPVVDGIARSAYNEVIANYPLLSKEELDHFISGFDWEDTQLPGRPDKTETQHDRMWRLGQRLRLKYKPKTRQEILRQEEWVAS